MGEKLGEAASTAEEQARRQPGRPAPTKFFCRTDRGLTYAALCRRLGPVLRLVVGLRGDPGESG
jgi:hypothetical protein